MPRRTKKDPRRAAFDRWFKGSEVVNEDGSPRVVFHGTRSPVDFDAFSFGHVRAADGSPLVSSGGGSSYLGPHFAESAAVAGAFACGEAAPWDSSRDVAGGDCGGRVIPVYLSIRNPLEFEDDDDLASGPEGFYVAGRSHILECELRELFRVRRGGEVETRDGHPLYRGEAVGRALTLMDHNGHRMGNGRRAADYVKQELAESAVRRWRREGYDGVRYLNTIETDHLGIDEGDPTWVPFSASQIKSAVGNDGRYRKGSPSIVSNPPAWSALGPGDPGSARELVGAMLAAGRRP